MDVGEASKFSPIDMSGMELLNPSREHCCIYRVPNQQRQVNPEAYTPQMVLIGPLHHAKKQEASRLMEDRTTADTEMIKYRYKTYLEMEEQKKIYYHSFCERVQEEAWKLKSYVEKNEDKIRKCYGESTTWVKSSDFVDMILHDAIFIMEHMLRTHYDRKDYNHDLVVSTPCLWVRVWNDLVLLENQLPYFVLKDLFNPVLPRILSEKEDPRFRSATFKYFRAQNVPDHLEFKHFTDLMRNIRIRSLKVPPPDASVETFRHLYNAEKLHDAGVEFSVMGEEAKGTINISFEKKQLKIASFVVEDETEARLRNIMALEQCHYPCEAYVCNYVRLLDFLINTEKDVELLVNKRIIENEIGDPGLVADMVNKLTYGIGEGPSCYDDIAKRLNKTMIYHATAPWLA